MADSSDICLDPLAPTIFHEPWWLDAATGGQYAVAEVADRGSIVGRLPFYLRKKRGRMVVEHPPLTHFMGPAIADCEGTPHDQFLHRQEITKQLILKLPKTSYYYLKCHRAVADVLAFQQSGFRASVQFTHEILPQSSEIIWRDMRDKARNIIRAASKKIQVTSGNDPDLFMRLYVKSIEQNKGEKNYLDVDVHSKLIGACLERGRGKIYEARLGDGTLAAAIFCVWDRVSCYYLLTSRKPGAHSGATAILVWEAIKDAAARNLIFDFDGYISEGGVRAASNFAHVVSPRFIAVRESVSTRIFGTVKSTVKSQTYYC